MIISTIQDCEKSKPLNNDNGVPTNIQTPFEFGAQHCQTTTTVDFATSTIPIDFVNGIIIGGIFLFLLTFSIFVTMFSDIKKYG